MDDETRREISARDLQQYESGCAGMARVRLARGIATVIEVEIMLYCPNCNELLDDTDEPCQKCGTKAAPSLPNEQDISDRSQPLPRFASYAELVNPNAKSKKRYLVVAVLAALLLLAREGGFVDGYLFRIKASSKTQIPLYGNQYLQSGDTATYTELSKVVDTTSNTKANQYGLGFQMFGASPLAVDLQEEIQNNLKKQTQISADVEEVALSGLYWLPFFKSGSCKYRVRLQFVGKESIVYTGVLDGVTDFDSSGISSIRTLKQTLGDEIATRVVKSVDDVIRK